MTNLKLNDLIKNKILIVILGPTASGKTSVSIELAKLLNIEVISADSRQIFKYLDIGTAKPNDTELKSVNTHFINIIKPDEYYSAGKFGNEAEAVANDIFSRGKLPVIVGGSGLYIQSVCDGFFEETYDKELRQNITTNFDNELINKGIDYLYDKLKKADEKSAELYSDKNPRRILRALVYIELTGIPFSQAKDKFHRKRHFKPVYFGIGMDRSLLYSRINDRTEQMWNNGLIEETQRILDMGFLPSLNSLNTVGYKEAINYLKGLMTKEQALEKMKQNTRHYAKRQMTWFRKIENIKWLSGNEADIAQKIYNSLLIE